MTERTRYLPGPFERLGVLALRASLALTELMDKTRNPARQAAWAAQYPLFRCPYTSAVSWAVHGTESVLEKPCGHTWDRRRISTEELRAEVWDHMARHVKGEYGLGYASRIVATIMERP
jgi:hypothetical protein